MLGWWHAVRDKRRGNCASIVSDSALEEIVSLILLCSDLDSQCLDTLQKGGAISKVLSAAAIAAHIGATNAMIVKAINQFTVCDLPVIDRAV